MTRIARFALAATAAAALAADAARAAEPSASLKKGTPDLKSAGPLAFGPDGILFVGDTQGAALFAIDTGDRTPAADKAAIKVEDLDEKVAALLGTDAEEGRDQRPGRQPGLGQGLPVGLARHGPGRRRR